MIKTGSRNLITDVPGLKVGQADDAVLRSGVTVLLPDTPMKAAIDIRGGGPGTRDTSTLAPENLVQEIHGLVLAGGSAFGLDAATGAQAFLRAKGIGYPIGSEHVPIVPQAILFDLLNGGNKDWGRRPPYQDLAYQACEAASQDFALGTVGAGYGATAGRLKGGLGSASLILPNGATIGALVAVNSAGDATVGESNHFLASPLELGTEFGGLGLPHPWPPEANEPRIHAGLGENTTLAIVATDAVLEKNQLMRVAIMAQTGLARAIYPVHTPLDGDVVFAVSTGRAPAPDPVAGIMEIGVYAANTLARAVARGVYEATAFEGEPGGRPAFCDGQNC